ncbi:MAG: hypothetical protein SPL13_06545 [Clostridia bacterium]|nr:hypothetical protein [Clostridia bacterium]
MAIQPEYGNIRISGKTQIPAVQVKAECKTEIPSDTVSKVLDVSAFCGGAECSAEPPFKISGTVIFNVIYCDAEGKVKKCECAQEFTRELSEDLEGKTFIPSASILKAGADVSGTRLTLSAVLSVGGKIIFSSDVACLSGGEGIIVNEDEKIVYKSLGVKRSVFPVEEEFTLPYEIAEVLSQKVVARLTEVHCGVGALIVDGEANLTALLLQNSENGDIIKEEKVLPFRFELESDEVMPKNLASAEVAVRSLRSDVSVDPETGKSTVTVLVALAVIGEAFAEETALTVNDAFSTSEKTELTFAQAEFCIPDGIKQEKRSVTGRCPVGIPAGASVIAAYGETAEITSLKTDKNINIVGVYSLKAIYRDADGKVGSVSMETPFEFKEEKPAQADIVGVSLYATGGKIRPISENESELSGDVVIYITFTKTQKIKFASGITAVGEKPINNAAVSVYIPLEGEGLFSLAKRLNTAPDDLAAANKDLTFPLTGKERIVIYRQK